MEYRLRTYSIFEYGQRRDDKGNPHQEDSAWPQPGTASPNDRLFIVCDGMGGHDAGEVASQTVCRAMASSVLGAGDSFDDRVFLKALSDAYDALDVRDTGAKKKMGTTMTFLKLHSGGATIAHIGDSRVYHIRPGKTAEDTRILFKTKDHSLVSALIQAGELTEEEAKTFPRRNVITRAMQPHTNPRPKADIAHITDIRAGDWFYLCSDGMLKNMDDTQLRHNFSDAAGDDEQKRAGLVAATEFNKDNHTAIMVHILSVTGDSVSEQEAEKEILDGLHEEVIGGSESVFEQEEEQEEFHPQRKRSLRSLLLLAVLVVVLALLLRLFGK